MSLRVLIADDHPPTRAGVRAALERGGCEVCAEVASAAQAVAAAEAERPDVCLLDVRMPGGGVQAAARIVENTSAAVLMLTVSEDERDLFDALRAGAVGYLLKDMDPSDLPAAVRSAAAGDAVLPGPLAARVVEELRRRPGSEHVFTVDHRVKVDLTPREAEVLDLLGEGLPTAAIATRLGLAPVTVRRHISMLAHRLGVGSREELLALARRSSA